MGLLDDVMNGTTLSYNTSYWNRWEFGALNGVFDSHASMNYDSDEAYYWLIAPAVLAEDGSALDFDLALTEANYLLSAPEFTGSDDRFIVLPNGRSASTVI